MSLPPGGWPRLREVFAGARALPADVRAAYLDEACGGDDALRQEAESLLASDGRAKSFLESPALLSNNAGVTKSLEGQRIGAYQLAARIGAGGMGEVYLARDTTLNRQVAIKVLLPAVANDPDRLARFRREAQVLASLNHPHIAQIHGFEEANDVQALVMELVEGQTLADRIASGALPIDETLTIASQIAEALEAAHEQGIIHRDLKPANIKVREDGTVKVLDFGLAKALDATSGLNVDAASSSPTLGAHATGAGIILGTAAYMSPEQARGKAVDRRADIWAFGCVLYEMLTGRRAFSGDSAADVMTAVVKDEPDWTKLPGATPGAIRTLLRRCLEKDRARRLDSATAARLEIDDVLTAAPSVEPVGTAVPFRLVTLVAMATLAGVAIAAIVAWIVTRPAPQAQILSSRFAIVTPPDQPLNVSRFDRDLALSPDGRHLVYRAGGSPNVGAPLMLREIDQLEARPIPGISALGVSFSPDSRWLAFFSNTETKTQIKRVSITGGPAIALATVTGTSLGVSWGDDNTIVFATDDPNTGLWRVSADGGEPTVLTTPDAAQHESDHGFPTMLPGGRGVLFTTIDAGQPNNAQVAVLDLRTGQRRTLVRGGSQAEYVDVSSDARQAGYLVYAAAGTLRAVRFDPVRLEVVGDSVTVVERLMTKSNGAANYAVSRQGTLFYVPGGVSVQSAPRLLVWVDRNGNEEPIKAPARAYGAPRISPDGRQLVVGINDEANSADLWILDLSREAPLRRLTFSPDYDGLPVWTPDSRRIIFNSDREGVVNWYSQAADGTGIADRLTTTDYPQYPSSIFPDGTLAAGFHNAVMETSTPTGHVFLFPLTGTASRTGPVRPSGANSSQTGPSDRTLFRGSWPQFSPNGRYLAYQSSETGRQEVFVRPFPLVAGGRRQISTAGGTRAAWARNGRELFYVDASNRLTAVSVDTTGFTFSAGEPAKMFDATYAEPFPPRSYDVSPDGQRFLVLKAGAAGGDPSLAPASIVVVEHWFEELNARVR